MKLDHSGKPPPSGEHADPSDLADPAAVDPPAVNPPAIDPPAVNPPAVNPEPPDKQPPLPFETRPLAQIIMGGIVIFGALAFLFGVVWVAIDHFSLGIPANGNTPATPPSASNAVAIIGSVTGVVGTLVATFFGIRAVQENATQTQQTVQQQATRAEATVQQARTAFLTAQETLKQQAEQQAEAVQAQQRTTEAALRRLFGELDKDQWDRVRQDEAVQRLQRGMT